MSKKIAITNQKGGVGKTTTAVNLAASLAVNNCRVLLIDLDPQGNATMGSGVDKNQLVHSINDVLLGRATCSEAIIRPCPAGYDLLPGNSDLTEAEIKLLEHFEREQCLQQALSTFAADTYDFILIDCPPALNMLTVNALTAANSVIIPMQCEYYALEGLASLMSTIEQIRTTTNPTLHIEGLLRTMFDGRSRLSSDVSAQLLEHFADKVYRTTIPRTIRLAEAPSHGLPIIHYDKNSQGASAYLVLAEEVLGQQRC